MGNKPNNSKTPAAPDTAVAGLTEGADVRSASQGLAARVRTVPLRTLNKKGEVSDAASKGWISLTHAAQGVDVRVDGALITLSVPGEDGKLQPIARLVCAYTTKMSASASNARDASRDIFEVPESELAAAEASDAISKAKAATFAAFVAAGQSKAAAQAAVDAMFAQVSSSSK